MEIIELMGEIPKSIAFAGKYSSEFFNRKGTSSYTPTHSCNVTDVIPNPTKRPATYQQTRHGPLDCVLHDKNLFPKEADVIALFLTPMLGLHPDKRAKASDLVHHNWLDGVLVQGETDVTRRAEQDETRGGR